MVWYELIDKYIKEHGHSYVPTDKGKRSLNSWVSSIRRKYLKGALTTDEHVYLQRIGFDFEIERGFRRWYNQYLVYTELWKKRDPRSNRKVTEDEMPFRIRMWMRMNRDEYKRGVLVERRRILLDKINVDWAPFESSWEEGFQMMLEFKNQYDHLNIPDDASPLRKWRDTQQKKANDGRMRADRRKRLLDIGLVLNPIANRRKRIAELVNQYVQQHGHANIPSITDNSELDQLINWMRKAYKNETLDGRLISIMDDLRFAWEAPN